MCSKLSMHCVTYKLINVCLTCTANHVDSLKACYCAQGVINITKKKCFQIIALMLYKTNNSSYLGLSHLFNMND
jgi:hypothetical protein